MLFSWYICNILRRVTCSDVIIRICACDIMRCFGDIYRWLFLASKWYIFASVLAYGVLNWISIHALFFWHTVECYFSSRFIERLHIERCTRWRFSLRSHCFVCVFNFRCMYLITYFGVCWPVCDTSLTFRNESNGLQYVTNRVVFVKSPGGVVMASG